MRAHPWLGLAIGLILGGIGHAQPLQVRPAPLDVYSYFRESGPVRVETYWDIIPFPMVWEEYDARGRLIRADFGMLFDVDVPPIEVEAVDVDGGLIHLESPLPEGEANFSSMGFERSRGGSSLGGSSAYSRSIAAFRYLELADEDTLRVDPELTASIYGAIEEIEPGDVLRTAVRHPVKHQFRYSPSRIHEERLFEDGSLAVSYSYRYGLNGLQEVVAHEEDDPYTIVFCAEYENERRISENVGCGFEETPSEMYQFKYDDQGRIVHVQRVWLREAEQTRFAYESVSRGAIEVSVEHEGGIPSVTTLRHDPEAQVVTLESLDASGRLPAYAPYVDLILYSLGLRPPPTMVDLDTSSAVMEFDDVGRLVYAETSRWRDEGERVKTYELEYGPDGKWKRLVETWIGEDGPKAWEWERRRVEADPED